MKMLCTATGATLLACSLAGFGQTNGVCGQILDAPLRDRADLTIDSRPAGLEIVGSDKEVIHVTCTADDMDAARNVKLRFSGGTDSGHLKIAGSYGNHNNLLIRIEVPRKTNLRVHMGAGEVTVKEIAGDKAIDLYAGQITISSERAWDYRRIEASVDIGEVKASAYGVDKGGFFRTFARKNDNGEYRLYAHIVTGEIDLMGNGAPAAAE